jgi:hypothetical protein
MALRKTTASNGWIYLSGVVNNPDIPAPLAPSEENVFVVNDQNGLGTHYGGLYYPNDSRSTAVLRLYFDPSNPPNDDSGYIQFGKLTSFGRPVPPGVLPTLGSRRFYSTERDQTFLEFMGPKDANLRLKGGPCELPFYPLNAALRQFTHFADYDTFYWHPMPNGSIRRGNGWQNSLNPQTSPRPSARPSQCASLVLPISPFLLTEASFTNYCSDENLLLDENISAAEADAMPFYNLVTSKLSAQDDPFPAVKDVQAVGSLLVITQDDGEEGLGGPLLVAVQNLVPNQNNLRQIRVWQIDRDACASIEHDATLYTLEQLSRWFAQTNLSSKSVNIPSAVRGWNGLRRPPHLVYLTNEPLFQLDLISVIYHRDGSSRRLDPRAGVTNRLVWSFDPVAECFDLTTKRLGAGVTIGNALKDSLWLYADALNNPPAADTYNTSAFTLAGSPWYDTAPPYPGGGFT